MTRKLLTYADCWRLTIILACAGLFLGAAPLVGLRVDWASLAPVFFATALLASIGVAYRLLGRDEGIAATTIIVAQIVLYANIAVLDNYLGLELRRPGIDLDLARLDAALGFDWWGYVTWVKSFAIFGKLLTLAYQSSLPQIAVALIILGFTRRFEKLDQFSLAFMFSSALTILIWTAFPSFGALALHYSQGLPEPTFELAYSKKEALQLLALQAGPTPMLRMDEFVGMIAFPSFHTVLALLTTFALWQIRFVGKLTLALNLIVLASIPADGGHYFVDIGGAVIVTAISLYLSRLVLRAAHEGGSVDSAPTFAERPAA